MAWASVTNKTERFDNTNWRKVVNPAIRFASKAPILSLRCLQVLPKWFKPSSHYTTLHGGRPLCCITWLDCLSLSRCGIHTMWLYVNDLQPGVTHYTTTVSPNDLSRSLKQVLSWKLKIGHSQRAWLTDLTNQNAYIMCRRCHPPSCPTAMASLYRNTC